MRARAAVRLSTTVVRHAGVGGRGRAGSGERPEDRPDREGYAVDTAETGTEAAEKLQLAAYDMVVLDVSLPDGTASSWPATCARAWSEASPPTDMRIIMLTARGGLADRVQGLDVGADDYVVKPFAMPELSARVRALLRRESPRHAVLEVGALRLDTARHLAHRGERRAGADPQGVRGAALPMSRPGHVVSSEELLDHVWDENADPFTQTVRVTVGTLRRKLTSMTSRRSSRPSWDGATGCGPSRWTSERVIPLPPWARTIRVPARRLTYSATGLRLRRSRAARPLSTPLSPRPSTRKPLDDAAKQKFYVSDAGTVKFLDSKAGEDGELVSADDLEVVQQAVNSATL